MSNRHFTSDLYKLLEDYVNMSSNDYVYINPHLMNALEDVMNNYSIDVPEGFDDFVRNLYEL